MRSITSLAAVTALLVAPSVYAAQGETVEKRQEKKRWRRKTHAITRKTQQAQGSNSYYGDQREDPYAYGDHPYAYGDQWQDPYAYGGQWQDPYAYGDQWQDPYGYGGDQWHNPDSGNQFQDPNYGDQWSSTGAGSGKGGGKGGSMKGGTGEGGAGKGTMGDGHSGGKTSRAGSGKGGSAKGGSSGKGGSSRGGSGGNWSGTSQYVQIGNYSCKDNNNRETCLTYSSSDIVKTFACGVSREAQLWTIVPVKYPVIEGSFMVKHKMTGMCLGVPTPCSYDTSVTMGVCGQPGTSFFDEGSGTSFTSEYCWINGDADSSQVFVAGCDGTPAGVVTVDIAGPETTWFEVSTNYVA
jgi:hypothetical protein